MGGRFHRMGRVVWDQRVIRRSRSPPKRATSIGLGRRLGFALLSYRLVVAEAARKIIIDTDPGIDDAFAILFALRSPELDVVACTSVFGNTATEQATSNLHRLLRFATTVIPVGRGAVAPLVVPARPYAATVHGADGLGDCGEAGSTVPSGAAIPIGHTMPDGTDFERLPAAALLIADTVLRHPGEITIVALGPLTNVALALALEPRIESQVAEVVIMGGSYAAGGNLTAAGEANIVHDPHAAERVFAASWPVTLVGLDVTNAVIMTSSYLDGLARDGGEEGRFLRSVVGHYERFFRAVHGADHDGVAAHDPTAMMWTVAPQLFSTAQGPATVITEGPAYGQTLIDRRPGSPQREGWTARAPIRYCTAVDSAAALELFLSRLCR